MKASRPRKRRLDEGQHQSFTVGGEEDRVVLIEWLNAAVGSESYLRASQIIHDIKSANAAGDTAAHDGVWWHVSRPGEKSLLTGSAAVVSR